MENSGADGGDGPEEKSCGEDAVDIEAVHQPSDDELHGGVGVEEGGEKNSELGGGDVEFVLEGAGGDGQIAAVDVVDEDGEDEEDKGGSEDAEVGVRTGHGQGVV